MTIILNRRGLSKSNEGLNVSQPPPSPVFYTNAYDKDRRQFTFAPYVFISPPYIFIPLPTFTTFGRIYDRRNTGFAHPYVVVNQPPYDPAINTSGYETTRLLLQRFQPTDTARVLVRNNVFQLDFYATPLKTIANRDVTFYPVTGGSVLFYNWDFGDGYGSSDRTPVHQYRARGVYTVTLSVTTLYGYFSISKQYYIEILRAPVLYDSAAVYVNYGQPGQRVLGATRGGCKFTVENTYIELDCDGARGDVEYKKYIEKSRASVELNLIELSPDAITALLPAAEYITDSTHSTITRKRQIASSDYFDSISIVGQVEGRENPIVCTVKNALCVDNFEMTFSENNEVTIKAKFIGHCDINNLQSEPFYIMQVE